MSAKINRSLELSTAPGENQSPLANPCEDSGDFLLQRMMGHKGVWPDTNFHSAYNLINVSFLTEEMGQLCLANL